MKKYQISDWLASGETPFTRQALFVLCFLFLQVSTVVEDFSSADEHPVESTPGGDVSTDESPKQVSFQLQNSDFDFLEQITTKLPNGNSCKQDVVNELLSLC